MSNEIAMQQQDSDHATLRETSAARSSRDSGNTAEIGSGASRQNTAQSGLEGSSFLSSGLRYRNSTKRGLQKQQSSTSGRAQDGNNEFSLAGPSDDNEKIRSHKQHQAYVEPGYTDLNPAYEQPGNVRPIWGLAEPLPRVIRRGMKPAAHEIEEYRSKSGEEDQEAMKTTDSQLEKGVFIGPRSELTKLGNQAKGSASQRERDYIQRFSKKLEPPSDMGQASQTQPTGPFKPLRPSRNTDEEGDEADLGIPRPPTKPLNQDQDEDEHDKESEVKDDEEMEDAHWQDQEDHVPLNRVMEEIHNNHTNWSIIRTKLREPLAEILAVLVLITIGVCANIGHTIVGSGTDDSMAWSWGFGTMMAIYIAGGVSGGHLNPAITIMLYIFRGFSKRKIAVYIFAQVLGAYIASLIAYGIYRNYILSFINSNPEQMTVVYNAFVTNRRNGIADVAAGFMTEFAATAFVAVMVLALGDDSNAPPGAGMNAFILGLVIAIETMAFSPSTGAALNPARDIGPRLALITVGFSRHDLFGDGWWIYGAWCATITGAIFGAILYDVAIFVGGESPINYPRKRVKRVAQKSKARWRHRFRRGGK